MLKRIVNNLISDYRNRNEYKLFYAKYKSDLRRLQINADLKNKYEGKRCFIIGNGPSLNDMDLSLLKDEYTFTVNQFPRNKQFESVKTNFHLWADDRFFDIDENRPEDLELLEVMKNVNTKKNRPLVFYSICGRHMVEKFGLDKILEVRYFAQVNFQRERFLDRHGIDLTKATCNYPTVVHMAIELAIYMGFKQIYLIGTDCTGFLTIAQSKMKAEADSYKYGYTVTENEKKRMERANNKFSISKELLYYSQMFTCYEILDSYANKIGVKLYNATPGGLLDSIERVEYMNVVRK